MRLLLIGLFLVSGIPLLGQASYEGRMVSSVELVTDPSLDTTQWRRLVTQKVHAPYSRKDVQTSVDALARTGRFRSVHTDVVPEPAGLRLRFILEPAYYFGLIDFPGAISRFNYARLLQTANLPDQEPYEQRTVSAGEKALVDFFKHNGFFEAQVSPQTEFDPDHGIANVNFLTDLGRQAKIRNVQIVGVPPEEASRLLGLTRSWRAKLTGAALTSGKHYESKRLSAATKLIKNDLAKRGYLANRVSMDVSQYHPGTERADLSISIEEKRKIDVSISGAKLSWLPFVASRQQKKLLPFYEEGSIDQDLVEEGRRNLLNYFQGKGFFNVRVTTSVKRQPEEVHLVYQIEKGTKYKVAGLVFRGNHNASDDALLQQVTVKKGRFLFARGKYSTKLVTQSVSGLKAYYQSQGYEDVAVDSQVATESSTIKVVFNITEGQQTRVDRVSLNGLQRVTRENIESKKPLQIRRGGAFSPTGLAKDRGQILAIYLDRGYLAADVKTNIQRHPEDAHLVDVSFNIFEGQQIRISQIAYEGAPHTKRSLITRSSNLWAEEPLSQSGLLAAESALYNEGIFDYASVAPKRPITDQSEEMVILKLHEAKRNTLTYGLGFEITRRGGNVPTGTVAIPGLPPVGLGNAKVVPSEDTFASPRGSIEYIRRNMRGLGETGTISILAGRLRQRVVATYAIPHFRGSSWRSLFSISGERTSENPLFTANLDNVSFQLEKTIDRKRNVIAQLRYSFGHTSLGHLIIPDLVLPEDRNVRLSTFSGSLIRDSRDEPLDAHRGFFQTADFGVTAEAIGASASFTRFLGQNAYYRPLPHGLVWANSVRLGLAKPFADSRIPTSERFFTGGGTTLRGFPINGAGPQRKILVCSNPNDPTTCSTITVPLGGNMLFVINSEIRFPLKILENLGGAVFYDGGNVYANINLHQFADQFSHTVGVGLRYRTPIGPVRFDIGRNLTPIPGIRATQFFVTLGQAF